MKLHSSYVVAFGLAVSAFSGCGGPSAKKTQPQKEPVNGDFVANLDKVFKAPYVTDCETSRRDAIYEAARALDAFQADAKNRKTELPAENEFYRWVRYGDFTVREVKFKPGVKPDASEYHSWDLFLENYRKYAPGGKPADMEWLARKLGATLSDDISRTQYGSGYGTTPTNKDLISEMFVKAGRCATTSTCAAPEFTATETAWLRVQPRFRELLDVLATNSAVDAEARKSARDSLVEEIGWSVYEDFDKHPGIRFEANTLTLRLDAGDFGFMRDAIEKYVVPVWTGPDFKFAIEWVDNPTDGPAEDLFRLLRDPGGLGRSFVRYKAREVHLFSNVRDRSIAHEIGHVLGLNDRYFTEWEPENCRYIDRWDETDLMADGETGAVKPDEFETLRKAYAK